MDIHIQKKLEAYRAKKRKEALLHKINEKVSSLFTIRFRTNHMITTKEQSNSNSSNEEKDVLIVDQDCDDLSSEGLDMDDTNENNSKCTILDVVTYILYFVLWATLLAIFIEFEFGLVFIVSSALLGIYLNTRTGPKKRNEVSAYSVFNKNCESIDGTLKAEQFEREIRYGPVAVH